MPCKQIPRRGATVIGWIAACACLRCTLDFDRFAPVAAIGGDSGSGNMVVDSGAAGSDPVDSSLPHDDASPRPIDGSSESSGNADQHATTDSAAGDVALEAACAPKQSCLNDGTTCATACTTSYDACVAACNDRQPCKITCEKTEGTCKRACETTCQTCTKDAGCESATSCQMAAQ